MAHRNERKVEFSKNYPISLNHMVVTDEFWKKEMELIRREVIPYQWEAINDRIANAAPSFCIRNFKVAAKITERRHQLGEKYQEKIWPVTDFELLPEDMEHMEERFYGFLFQDSDLSKWLEAVAYSLAQQRDTDLEKVADGAIDLICAAQQENGYLDTYYIINDMSKVFTNLRDHHELYCFGHLTEAAVAYYQATGKDKLLKAAMGFADYICTCFGPEADKKKGYPGHEIAEMALIRLYEVTGERKYLDLSFFFINQRGTRPYYFDMEHPKTVQKGKEEEERHEYHQAHLPVRMQKEAVGHAVRAVYLYSGMADVARITEDESLFQACDSLWENITRKKMYVTGGIGATHMGEAFSFDYDLPNDTAYAETCASIGLIFFARRMLQMKVDRKYSDVMERVLYNGVLSGIALDGKSFFYVNPLEVLPEACHKDQRKFHVKPVRQKWFGCACCPPNIARLISSVANYAYTQDETTFYVHLYLGAQIHTQMGKNQVELQIESEFPWEGKVRITTKRTNGASFTVALRIPEWCSSYTAYDVKGSVYSKLEEQAENMYVKDGYLYIEKSWIDGEELQLDFQMEIQLLQANPNVREDRGRLAVLRGPIVYCMEEIDNGKNLSSLLLNPKEKGTVEVSKEFGQEVRILKMPGKKEMNHTEEQLYSLYEPPVYEDKLLTFIPYYTWANRGEGEMQVWTRYVQP